MRDLEKILAAPYFKLSDETLCYMDGESTCITSGGLAWQRYLEGINCPAFYQRLIPMAGRS